MNRSSVCFAIAILTLAGNATAQVGELISDQFQTRELRQEAGAPDRVLKIMTGPDRDVQWTVDAGMSFTDRENGSEITSTPFALKAILNGKRTTVRLAGDGYTRIDRGGSTDSGLSDFLVAATHQIWPSAFSTTRLVGEFGILIPSGGDVGSSDAGQRLGATYATPLGGGFSTAATGRLTRTNADTAPGVSRITRTVSGEVGYTFEEVNDVALSLSRGYRPGVGGTTKAGASYTRTLDGGQRITGGYTRGLTDGAKDNSFLLSVKLPF